MLPDIPGTEEQLSSPFVTNECHTALGQQTTIYYGRDEYKKLEVSLCLSLY